MARFLIAVYRFRILADMENHLSKQVVRNWRNYMANNIFLRTHKMAALKPSKFVIRRLERMRTVSDSYEKASSIRCNSLGPIRAAQDKSFQQLVVSATNDNLLENIVQKL